MNHADSRADPIRVGVWCLYEGIVKNGHLFKSRDAGLGADLLKVWCDLYAYGEAHGFEFLTFDQVEDWERIDAIILCDRPLPGNPLVDVAMQSRAEKYLITSECPIIYAPSWDREYHRLFRRVWTWNDTLVDGEHYLKSNSVTDPTMACDVALQKAAFPTRKLVTMIAGAKSSQHPNELYSHRVRAIRWFEVSAPAHFDLYGMGWKKEQFPSYQGAVTDKLSTLARYRFCICYENALGYPGYITEKMLDCLRVGTIPVYGGAPNVTRWIPADCFISVGQFKNFFELFDFLNGMDEVRYGAYLDRIERFVTGPDFYPFSIASMVEGITRVLHWDLRAQKKPGTSLVQNPSSFRMEVRAPFVPLIVLLAYDPDSALDRKLRGLWQFFSNYFPMVQFYFVRHSEKMGRGEILDNGNDLVIGAGGNLENALHDMVLMRHQQHFFLLRTSLFSVFDPEALRQRCGELDAGIHFTGPAGTLLARDTLLAMKNHRNVGGGANGVSSSATEWPVAFMSEHQYSEDPMVILEHMRNILCGLED